MSFSENKNAEFISFEIEIIGFWQRVFHVPSKICEKENSGKKRIKKRNKNFNRSIC
jgi:hypothetical protein